ncbi:MAG: 4-vinyl reductase [Negativicutes bacterium]|nr:4-vinyl reductase [Negativicutes bacterium]MDR3593111.1 4-vinyl reductase [Negativicutes bacterium]
MFKYKEASSDLPLSWDLLGDIRQGRPHLGDTMPVVVYRLFQFSLRHYLNSHYDSHTCSEIFRETGKLAGQLFCRQSLDKDLDFNGFVALLQQKLKEMGIGILIVEAANADRSKLVFSVAEDLDCAGLPITEETVCDYDEGFFAGIMEEYTGKPFDAREVDCWATGGRVCRFQVEEL